MKHESLEHLKLRMMARKIKDNLAFARVVRDAKESMREAVYVKIKPHK